MNYQNCKYGIKTDKEVVCGCDLSPNSFVTVSDFPNICNNCEHYKKETEVLEVGGIYQKIHEEL